MAKLFMLMGLPCSGKTTLAKKLEQAEDALFLEADLWMSKIVGDGFDFNRRAGVHEVQFIVARRVLELGRNVVMDFGFFERADRDKGRAIAQEANAQANLVFLDPPYQVLVNRITARNKTLPPDNFHITAEHLDLCVSWLERPHSDEALWEFKPV